MKIGIVTVYNSDNCGSFLQAYAMKCICERGDNEVVFYKTDARHPIRQNIKSIIGYMLRLRWKEALFLLKRTVKFKFAGNVFKCKYLSEYKADLCILGSDEIWNVSRKAFAQYSIFWGDGIECSTLISYATSVNNAKYSDVFNYRYAKQLKERACAVSVRDSMTQECLKSAFNIDSIRVLDPTLALNPENYRKMEIDIPYKKFILVYASTKGFTDKQCSQIRNFAAKNNLTLISINNYEKWCDVSYPASPGEFLAFYRKADYVVTDTYHGTVFSIIYKKQFFCIGRDNKKVMDLISYWGLNNRNTEESGEWCTSVFEKEIEWTKELALRMDEERKRSIEFIEGAIRSADKKK